MRYLIDFKNSVQQSDIDSYLTGINATIVKVYNSFEKTYLIDCDIEITTISDIHEHIVRDDLNAISLLDSSILIDKTFLTNHLTGPINEIISDNDNDWWKWYCLPSPNFNEPVYRFDRRGSGIVVYILDSGIEISHTEFIGRPVENLFSFNNDYTDYNGHGTAIASVITGAQTGITDATVKSVKIFDPNHITRQSDLLNALESIYNDFKNLDTPFAVVNCSWQIEKNSFIESKISQLINDGLFFVVAAGNSGTTIENVTPASMENVLTIGSYNKDFDPSDFSNYSNSCISVTNDKTNGGQLDGWAPGEDIYVARIGNQYGLSAGTSIAAGIHSAVLAYNITQYGLDFILDNSEFYHGIYRMLGDMSFGRKNFLNLSEQQYIYSTNKITTIAEKQNPQPLRVTELIKGRENTKFIGTIVPLPSDIIRIDIIGNLPDFLKITNKGKIIGIHPQVDTVTVNEINAVLVIDTESSIPIKIEIISIPSDFDLENDSSGDNDIDVKIRLLDLFCADWGGACTGSDTCCFNNCFGNCLCYQPGSPPCGFKPETTCECIGQ